MDGDNDCKVLPTDRLVLRENGRRANRWEGSGRRAPRVSPALGTRIRPDEWDGNPVHLLTEQRRGRAAEAGTPGRGEVRVRSCHLAQQEWPVGPGKG